MRSSYLASLALIFAGGVGCHSPERSASASSGTPSRQTASAKATCPCASAGVVSAGLLAFLSRARAAHGQADLAEEQGDKAAARSALEQLLRAPRPGAGLAPELREVLADTHGRLAELLAQDGNESAALTQLRTGLRLATETTYYRGRLFELMGVVEKQRYKRLRAAGDEEAAEAARKRAMKALKQAIAIQDAVVRARLPAPAASRSGP